MVVPSTPELTSLIAGTLSIDRLEARLRPSYDLHYKQDIAAHDGYTNFSQEGFLGVDESLIDLVREDWQTLDAYGVTHAQVADALEIAIEKGKAPNRRYRLERGIITGGIQDCPWTCAQRYKGGNGIIPLYRKSLPQEDQCRALERAMRGYSMIEGRDMPSRIAIVSELHPHLIRHHFFFEGKQSPWRADPALLIDALELGPSAQNGFLTRLRRMFMGD